MSKMRTKHDITMPWSNGAFDHGEITIPKGTRVTDLTADGSRTDGTWFFVDEFGFLGENRLLRHDAVHYGIRVNASECEMEVTEQRSVRESHEEARDIEEEVGRGR